MLDPQLTHFNSQSVPSKVMSLVASDCSKYQSESRISTGSNVLTIKTALVHLFAPLNAHLSQTQRNFLPIWLELGF